MKLFSAIADALIAAPIVDHFAVTNVDLTIICDCNSFVDYSETCYTGRVLLGDDLGKI